jgi:hypothetical protein
MVCLMNGGKAGGVGCDLRREVELGCGWLEQFRSGADMKSPFPGMDPFIEARGLWTDFHDSLIVELRRILNSQLPPRYEALLGERTYIDVVDPIEGTRGESVIKPDVRIDRQQPSPEGTWQRDEGQGILAASVLMHPEMNVEETETYIEIRETAAGDRVVTCIELLSPTNKKPGSPGWGEYERKRQLMLEGASHFIEIDLLRGGRRRAMREPWPKSPYYILVMRREEAPSCHVFPAYATDRLPTFPIPLVPPDADLLCDLQAAVDSVLGSSRYERRLQYFQPIDPPLAEVEMRILAGARDQFA